MMIAVWTIGVLLALLPLVAIVGAVMVLRRPPERDAHDEIKDVFE